MGIKEWVGKRVEHGTDGVGVTARLDQLMLNVTGELNKVLSSENSCEPKVSRCIIDASAFISW